MEQNASRRESRIKEIEIINESIPPSQPLGGSGGMIRSSWGAVPHHEAQQQPSSKLDPSMLRYQTHFSPRGAQMTGGTGLN